MLYGGTALTDGRLRRAPSHYARGVRVLIVGSGGREHALAWKLAQSPQRSSMRPRGTRGSRRSGSCHPARADDADGLLALGRRRSTIELAVIGPEVPLVAGRRGRLRAGGIAVFGPSAAAARIEGSKAFAKDVIEAAGVPAARTLASRALPCVVKVDGLAAGKGVFVCRTQEELDAGARRGRARSAGRSCSRSCSRARSCRSSRCATASGAMPLGAARDYKRIGDGDSGPNTGGMGAFSPVAGLRPARGRGARRADPPAGVRASSRAAARRSSACSTPA